LVSIKGVSRDIIQHFLNINPQNEAKEAATKENVWGLNLSSEGRSTEAVRRKRHQKSQVLRIAGKYSVSTKKNGKMRMCIDFTDLNKACKKDPFPIPWIDTSIDKAARCKRFSLLDCFFKISSNLAQQRRWEDKFHYSLWNLLLHQNALRTKEYRLDLR
jgi:hypothetical protein